MGEYLLNVRLWAVLRLLEDEASAEEDDKMLFGRPRITTFIFLSLQVRTLLPAFKMTLVM